MLFLAACAPAKRPPAGPADASPYTQAAQRFRQALKAENYDAARVMMSASPRRWFEKREGEGEAWGVGPDANDPWKGWDNHFRSQSAELGWEAGDHVATLTVQETNDYYKLLERSGSTTAFAYFFDDSGKISGLLIRAVSPGTTGRKEEFLRWAKEHEPQELEYVLPGGKIDPSGDHPPRVRALLNRWREAAGLPSMP
jgi:hypothetical protein